MALFLPIQKEKCVGRLKNVSEFPGTKLHVFFSWYLTLLIVWSFKYSLNKITVFLASMFFKNVKKKSLYNLY